MSTSPQLHISSPVLTSSYATSACLNSHSWIQNHNHNWKYLCFHCGDRGHHAAECRDLIRCFYYGRFGNKKYGYAVRKSEICAPSPSFKFSDPRFEFNIRFLKLRNQIRQSTSGTVCQDLLSHSAKLLEAAEALSLKVKISKPVLNFAEISGIQQPLDSQASDSFDRPNEKILLYTHVGEEECKIDPMLLDPDTHGCVMSGPITEISLAFEEIIELPNNTTTKDLVATVVEASVFPLATPLLIGDNLIPLTKTYLILCPKDPFSLGVNTVVEADLATSFIRV